MIAYHWSPCSRRESIFRSGLVVGSVPHVNYGDTPDRESHANPHISMAKTPSVAWMLSGLHMLRRGLTPEASEWDLWEIDLTGIRYRRHYPGGDELICRTDIRSSRLTLIAHRPHVKRLVRAS